MKALKVSFLNHRKEQLAARLDLPEDEQPIAYALFAHCFTCTKNIKAAANIAAALNREKIAVLRFDFTGLGQSEGDFADTNFSTNVADLVAAAEFMAQEHQAPQIIIGHSLGGAAVLQAAGAIPSVRAVVTIAAPHDPGHVARHFAAVREQIEAKGIAEIELAGRNFTIKQQFLEDLEMQQLDIHIKALKTALLVMHSPRDTTVAIENAAQIYQAAKHPKSFISLDDADHLLMKEEDSRYVGMMIAAWSRRYIDMPGVKPLAEIVTDNRVTTSTDNQGFFTELFANGHALVADEPTEYGGTDRGPSPYEYLLAALGACTSMTLQMYARRKKLPLEKAVVRLSHQKIHAKDCGHCEATDGKIDRMEREIELIGKLDE
ncbi:MAG: alpha/beta fold hydrolase, partial [Desulfuromonadales bacterium]|nr:alpha/beta fold hydrolase [Desulfuromonadales bacterium]